MTVPARQPIRRDLPQLLDAERVELRLRPSSSSSVATSVLVRLPRTPSQKIVTFARMSTPGSNVGLRLAVLVDAAVAGAHADDASPVVQHL